MPAPEEYYCLPDREKSQAAVINICRSWRYDGNRETGIGAALDVRRYLEGDHINSNQVWRKARPDQIRALAADSDDDRALYGSGRAGNRQRVRGDGRGGRPKTGYIGD